MLFVNHATNTKSAKDYFTAHLSRSDYYMRDDQEIAGQWHGRGAELLGLSGTVDKDSYFRLCENINPETGEQLTPRVKSDRRVLYDFTFDAPKSVTLAYELGDDKRISMPSAYRYKKRWARWKTPCACGFARTAQAKTGKLPTWCGENLFTAQHVLWTALPDPQLH